MEIEGRPTVKLEVSIRLSEEEAGALDALFGYSCDAFLKLFYEHMGKSYLQPYEKGFRSLHANRAELKILLDRARNARKVFDGKTQ